MTYGLPDSFALGATKRLSSIVITTKRQTRKSATQPLLDEWKYEGYRKLGKWLYDLSYIGWWKRFKPQPEETPKSKVRFTETYDI